MATVMGLVSAVNLQLETAQDVAEILYLYQNDGFGFCGLIIRQAALKNEWCELKN